MSMYFYLCDGRPLLEPSILRLGSRVEVGKVHGILVVLAGAGDAGNGAKLCPVVPYEALDAHQRVVVDAQPLRRALLERGLWQRRGDPVSVSRCVGGRSRMLAIYSAVQGPHGSSPRGDTHREPFSPRYAS